MTSERNAPGHARKEPPPRETPRREPPREPPPREPTPEERTPPDPSPPSPWPPFRKGGGDLGEPEDTFRTSHHAGSQNHRGPMCSEPWPGR